MRKLVGVTIWLSVGLFALTLLLFAPRSWYCAQLSGAVNSIVFAPDSQRIALLRSDLNKSDLWTIDASQPLYPFETPGQVVLDVAFAPNGRTIATSSIDLDFRASTIRIWDAHSFALLHTLTGPKYQTGIAYSPDSKTLLSAGYDDMARLWDVESGTLLHVLTGHTDLIESFAFAPDGKSVVTGSDDSTARLWDVESGNLIYILQHPNKVSYANFAPDGSTLVTSDYTDVRIWDRQSGQLLHVLTGH